MRTLVPPAPMPAPERAPEPRVHELGRRIAAGQARAGRSRTRMFEDRGMELLSRAVDAACAIVYLLQFVEPRVVTEDTMRHGLAV